MAYLFGDGFDFYGSISDTASRWDTANLSVSALSGTTPFGVGQAIYLQNNFYNLLQKGWGSNEATVFFAIRVRVPGGGTTGQWAELTLCDGSSVQVAIRFDQAGNLTLLSGSTVLATIAGVFPPATWIGIQGKVVINNTTGSIEIRVNGATTDTYSYTGVNTRGGTSNNYANALQLTSANGSGNTSVLIDDLFLCSASGAAPNTWTGDIRALQQVPTGATQTQFTATGAGSNYAAVADLIQNGDTSYVSSTTAGNEDKYSLGAIGTSYTVTGVNYLACWRKSDSGTRSAALSVAANGSGDTTEFTQASLSTTYTYSSAFLATDPTGAAWTPANVNSAIIGIKVAS
jgi:hypothetical protein